MVAASWLITSFILATGVAAETGLPTGEAVTLVQWDFGQEGDVNFDGWPDGWRRATGTRYPPYVQIGLAPDPAPAGDTKNTCLRIDLDGGAAQVLSPSISVSDQFSYIVQVRIRTENLHHDSAYASLTFCDESLRPMVVHHSQRIREARDWTEVTIGPVSPADASLSQALVRLHLEPGERFDLSGAAQFDDVRVARLPRMALELAGEVPWFTDPKDVVVTCRASGFAEASPVASFTLVDVWGHTLSEVKRPLIRELPDDPLADLEEDGDGLFAGSVTWRPPIEQNGYYEVRASIGSHTTVMRQSFAVMDPWQRGREGEFGWTLPEGDQHVSLKELPSLLAAAGVHWVKFPTWYDAKDSKRAEELARFAERLSSEYIQMVALLDSPPQATRELFGNRHDLPVASVFLERDVWQPALEPVLTRLSLKVRWWQLGGDEDTSFASLPNFEGKLREVRDELSHFGDGIRLGMPWRVVDATPEMDQPPWDFLSFVAEPSFTADEIRAYWQSETPSSPTHTWMVLEPLPRDTYDLATRARDLVGRMMAAKQRGIEAVFVPNPFDDQCGLLRPDGSPTELLLPWRTTAHMIAGAEFLGSLQLPGGSSNYVFARGEEAVMVVWNDHPTVETIYLGEEVQQWDLWGRSRPVRHVEQDNMTRQVIDVGALPTFVTGLHASVARWRIAFQFETDQLISMFGQKQEAGYRYHNAFSRWVSGTVAFHVPDMWETDHRPLPFKLGPDEHRQGALGVVLRASASSGRQPIRVDFQVAADRNYRFSVYRQVEVGLGDVEVEVNTRLDEYGNLVVEQWLTNQSDRRVSFNCMLLAPDRRRQRRQVFGMARGRRVVRFVLPQGEQLLGKTLLLRAEEIGGVRLLNHRFVAEP